MENQDSSVLVNLEHGVNYIIKKTERVGFEPTETLASLDFKSSAFDHSATSPQSAKN